MNRRISCLSKIAVTISLIVLSMPMSHLGAQERRRFTVRDSIEVSTFVLFSSLKQGQDMAHFSPDGRSFFVLSEKGSTKNNEVEETMWLFDSSTVEDMFEHKGQSHEPKPIAIARMSIAANPVLVLVSDPMWNPQWLDARRIAFLGRNKTGVRHLYVVDTLTQKLQQLSPAGLDVTAFSFNKDMFVFTAMPATNDLDLYQSGGPELPDVQIGTGYSLFNLLYPHWEEVTFGNHTREVWEVRNGKSFRLPVPSGSMPFHINPNRLSQEMLSVSPSGRYLVTVSAAKTVPSNWNVYGSAPSYTKIDVNKPSLNTSEDDQPATQYQIIDLKTGRVSELIDAPSGDSTGFHEAQIGVWSPDEKEVIISSTFIPPKADGTSDNSSDAQRPWHVAIEMGSGKLTKISQTQYGTKGNRLILSGMEWRVPGRELVFRYFDFVSRTAGNDRVFENQGGNWIEIPDKEKNAPSAGKAPQQRFSVTVRQSLNDPPSLIAVSANDSRSIELLDENSQLRELDLGEASVFKWLDEEGHEWTGGLLKPPDYVPGHRYPLVIQTHGFDEKQFLAYGPYATAMAARPLAARNIIVLQVGSPPYKLGKMSDEPDAMGKGFLGAIRKLDTDALIDPRKVGLIGFSRTGWSVLNSLVRFNTHFAAATLAESTYNSFGEYTLNADYLGPDRIRLKTEEIGSAPFGDGLRRWISDSPGFNTDKIDAPILFEANNPPGLIYAWDIYALLRLQNKPVDLLYIRNGDHALWSPLERLTSQEMTVDWYDFWLNGHEDSDPTKAKQYGRWRELRKAQATSITGAGK